MKHTNMSSKSLPSQHRLYFFRSEKSRGGIFGETIQILGRIAGITWAIMRPLPKLETNMRRTLNQDRRVVMNAMIENYNLTVIGSKEKTLFFADATGKGDLVEVPVDVKTMTSRQLLDAALDFTK